MLNPKIEEAFNKQINAELYSAYLYLSMSAYFEARSLGGMANWMRIQAQEEVSHAMKFFTFLNDRDGRVILAAIDQPKTDWDSPAEAFQEAFQHEQKITALINDLSALATAEKDFASHNFLEWFVAEQVEEENAVRTILDQFKLAGSDGVGQLILDERLGQRTAAPSAAPETGAP